MHKVPHPLKGRAALVTGSSNGIGLAVAKDLAKAGCNIVLHGLEAEDAMQSQREALESEHGVSVSYIRADLSEPKEIKRMVADILQRHGVIDVVVNNAVTRSFDPVVDLPVEAWDKSIAVNVSAAFHLIRLTLPTMLDRGWGRIFNITSVYGSRGAANRVGYVTSKHALIGMTRAVALETLNRGVTCNAICPGSVLTPDTDNRVRALMADESIDRDEATRKFLAGKQPIGRFIESGHVSELLSFLCGEAGRDITGAVLPVDGGWLAS